MRIFVFEYTTGGGFAENDMLAGLVKEGDMMLAAVVRDLLAVGGVDVVICRDRRMELPPLPVEIHWVDGNWQASWNWCVESADAVLPIAPETDGLLEWLCRSVAKAGKQLLNSSADAVAQAARKQATLDQLELHGVPVAQSWRADALPPTVLSTVVAKPDVGVGCCDIHLITGERALNDFLIGHQPLSDWLVQPYIDGQAASLSLLVGEQGACLLGCNLQRVAQVDDGLVLLGCVVNGLDQERDGLRALAQDICRSLPGLWGYVGIDFVMTKRGPVVLEVNPRLTTSYVGLSRSTGLNIGELLLRLAERPESLPGVEVCGKPVHVDLELGRVA